MSFKTENKVASVFITELERDAIVTAHKQEAELLVTRKGGFSASRFLVENVSEEPDYIGAAKLQIRWRQLLQISNFQRMPSVDR